jgi:signal transduction histidine kinase
MGLAGGISFGDARTELIRRPDLVALPRIAIAATMAVFLVVRDVSSRSAEPAYLRVIASLVIVLLAASGIIHMLTNIWESRRTAFWALGGAGTIALLFLYGFEARSYLLALFWVVAEAALLSGLPMALGVWSAMSAGYVVSEIWSSGTWTLPSEPTIALRVIATAAVVIVAGSLTAAAWAVRAALRERAVSDRLRELDQMKNAFLQAVSHELRTPLASILGYALLLEDKGDKLDGEHRGLALGQLAASARKLNQLVADLLDVDRLSRGIIEPQRSPTDVGRLVARVIEETPVGEHAVRAELDRVLVWVDASKVERIVENLLSNAAKYSAEDSTICVRVEPAEAGVLIAVEDGGPGVPDELKASIFGAFERGEQSTLHAPGVGIGLSLVARFAELHGGRAWVEDRAEGGSSFRVFLPGERIYAERKESLRGA